MFCAFGWRGMIDITCCRFRGRREVPDARGANRLSPVRGPCIEEEGAGEYQRRFDEPSRLAVAIVLNTDIPTEEAVSSGLLGSQCVVYSPLLTVVVILVGGALLIIQDEASGACIWYTYI